MAGSYGVGICGGVVYGWIIGDGDGVEGDVRGINSLKPLLA